MRAAPSQRFILTLGLSPSGVAAAWAGSGHLHRPLAAQCTPAPSCPTAAPKLPLGCPCAPCLSPPCSGGPSVAVQPVIAGGALSAVPLPGRHQGQHRGERGHEEGSSA